MPPTAPTVLKRLDSKVDELSHSKAHLQKSTCEKRHGLYLPAGSRHELYAELLPELFVRDLSEIENVFRLRIAFAAGTHYFEGPDDDETEDEPYDHFLHPKLAGYIKERRLLSAQKARFFLANPEAVATIGGLLKQDTYLYIQADRLNPCAIVWSMLKLRLSCVILDMRAIVEHNVFLKRFFEAAQRADLRVDKLISLYGGCAGYSWAHSIEGHETIAEYAKNIWAQDGEEADSWFRCNDEKERVRCWCEPWLENETSDADVDRREIIASNTKISELYRGFLTWLQAEDDEEPHQTMIQWLQKSGFELYGT